MSFGYSIRKISYHLPKKVERNDQLKILYPEWEIDNVVKKIGIFQRYISDENETSLDLGLTASIKLFTEYKVSSEEVDSLIFVTQSPDYLLPPSSCILQEKLSLKKNILALDINLGCSGFVNTLAVATSLINSQMVRNCLIICGETYSKYINEKDRTNRLIFSDGGSACLVEKNYKKNSFIGKFNFGCDGKGSKELMIEGSGARNKIDFANQKLFMNGPAILLFTLSQVPPLLNKTLNDNDLKIEDIDLFVFHQASKLVLDLLSEKIGIKRSKMYSNLENKGNTVSCSIPIALKDACKENKLNCDDLVLIIGFGVGYSLGSTIIKW